jgi:alpha-1,3/alpha-1,6-mannosyltransferase
MIEALVLLIICLVVASLCLRGRAARRRELKKKKAKMRIAFLHPDLGLGGAERLVVDAAISAQELGHEVVVYTAYHDPKRAFKETADGTLQIVVVGSFLPARILGRGQVACAAVRGVYGAAVICGRAFLGYLGLGDGVDVAVVDQVPHGIPLLRLCLVPVVFYCHFPDKLLVQQQGGGPLYAALRAAYRRPFDLLEEFCIGAASSILVNSAFTARVFARSFRVLRTMNVRPAVLHPSVPATAPPLGWPVADPGSDHTLKLLSINRFEQKKNLGLAILALWRYYDADPTAPRVRLVFAGGFDSRLADNVACLAQLRAQAAASGLSADVEMCTNVSEADRSRLLGACAALVYTPESEHFGIVPLEAMEAGRPVIAVRSGGPCETVIHGQTGWLCEPTPEQFGSAYAQVVRLAGARAADSGASAGSNGNAEGSSGGAGATSDDVLAGSVGEGLRRMGQTARKHVEAHFSRAIFGQKLEAHLREAVAGRVFSSGAEAVARAAGQYGREEKFE